MVAYVLFPIMTWCWILSCCQIARREEFKEAYILFIHNKHKLDELKNYQQRISRRTSFDILKMNQLMAIQRIKNHAERLNIAKQIRDSIMQNTSSNYGIVDGKMAALIWLSLWDRYNQENTTQLKLKLFAELKEAIFLHQLPINFRNGLCGIAWGLIFLYSQEFIPDIDESILNVIDNEIHSINLSNVTDKSLYYGTAGIVAYYVCRELYNKHKINSTISNKRYFRNIRKECILLINKSSEHAALYYSHLCKNIEDLHLFESFKPQLNDWMTFPTTIPQKPQYWSYSMDNGCLGYTVQILQNRTRN